MKILVVDDDPMNLNLLSELLSRVGGHQTREAVNGADALKIIETENEEFDMIITDMDMPVLNGLGLLEKIKGLTIIKWLVSGRMDNDLASDAMQAGATGAFMKTVLYEEFRKAGLIS